LSRRFCVFLKKIKRIKESIVTNIIYNAHVLTCAEAGRIENGYVEFSEKGIISVKSGMPEHTADVMLDAQGGFVVPGFIDAHSHIGMSGDGVGFESDETNEITDPITPQLRAIDALNPRDRCFTEALDGGVTAAATGPGSANGIGGQFALVSMSGERIDDMIIKAPLAMKFALGENPKVCYHSKNRAPETRMATAAVIRAALEKARRYKAQLEAGKDVTYDDKCEALIAVLDRKIQAHIHCHRADDIFTAIRIAKEFSLDYVIVHGTEGHLAAQELKKEGARVLSGPLVGSRCKPELTNFTAAAPGILAAAGVETAIITDAPELPQQYLALSAAIAVREGMDEDSALRSITSTPAHILGVDGIIGSLENGKRADLSLFDRHPVELMARTRAVFVNGKREK